MIIYTRLIAKELFILRAAFFLFVTAGLLALGFHYEKMGYLLCVFFIFLSFPVVKNISVTAESFSISKYYFFGLIKKSWHFSDGDTIKLSSFEPDFGQEGEATYLDDPWGLSWIYSVFAPRPRIKVRRFEIQKFDGVNRLLQRTAVLLGEAEYKYLQKFIKSDK